MAGRPLSLRRLGLDLGEGGLGGGPLLAGKLADRALEDDEVHHVLDEGALVLVEAVDALDLLEQVEVGDRRLSGAVGGDLSQVVE